MLRDHYLFLDDIIRVVDRIQTKRDPLRAHCRNALKSGDGM